ncbi:MAG TPA: hypothetical protein DD413_04140 [Ruminococcus sp.]|nr:hypothetical protein [Ruminococcus sp.]
MALSNAQLLMLDNLIYTDYVYDGMSVGEIIKVIEEYDFNVSSCEMTSSEWKELVSMIKNEPSLLNYKVTNYVDDTTGMRAACFVNDESNPTDVNVVFRGTKGDYEWHDNGQGGYLSDTSQQQTAADYVNGLPDKYGNNMTVTGHSKGGNKAQYVTIVTDRIAKCVSYDGQGFSEEFLQKYTDEIAKKSQSIVSISASYDFVNCLLYPIAGTKIYIDTKDQDDFTHYHKPNILFDNNGNLRPQIDQSDLSKLINEYTTYMISNLDEPERSITIDGLIALLEKGKNKESVIQIIYACRNAISHLDDFVFDYIGDTYGFPAELAVTYIAAVICPYLFLDDLVNCGKEMLETVIGGMMSFTEEVNKKLQQFGEKAAEYGRRFVSAITTFAQKASDLFNKSFNAGYRYASDNTCIRVNTSTLRSYADRLYTVNQRIVKLDGRLDKLYTKVGLFDLWNLLQADVLTGYSWRLNRCINYLNDTAYEFEEAERSISSQI